MASRRSGRQGGNILQRETASRNLPRTSTSPVRSARWNVAATCVGRFPKGRVRPRHFASAQLLATHPDRHAIVENNRDISKAKAREIMRLWRAKQAGAALPAAEADEFADDDLLDVEGAAEIGPTPTDAKLQSGDQDLPQEDAELTDEAKTEPTAPEATSAPAKEVKAKGPKKKETEEEATLKENRRLLNIIVDIARAAIAERKTIEDYTPEDERQFSLVIEPDLAPTMEKGSEALAVLAAWYTKISSLSDEASEAAIKEGRIKTSPKSATAPDQVGAS